MDKQRSIMSLYTQITQRRGNVTWLLILTVTVWTLVFSGVSVDGAIVVNPGRHICMKEEKQQTQVKKLETFCRPLYTKQLHMCERGGKYKVCTSFRLIYQLAYREKVSNEVQSRMIYTCCPGWTQLNKADRGCMKPVCEQECHNGGTCSSPGLCKCRRGWVGAQCQTDLNECSHNGSLCQHKCVNTPGSYQCRCEDGFSLGSDGRSCTFCLSCLSEYSELIKGYTGLVKRVMQLEKEKEELRRDMSLMADEQEKHLNKLRDDVINVKSVMADMTVRSEESMATTMATGHHDNKLKMRKKGDGHSNVENDDHVVSTQPANHNKVGRKNGQHSSRNYGPSWSRLRSLSEQIAMLEERLEDCTCKYVKPGTLRS